MIKGDEKYPLFVDVENVIGRKDCSIVLKNDPAISRKHAVITVTHPDNHVPHSHVLPTVKLKDTSRYGCFVNQKKISEECLLNSGDSIKFGSDKSKFSLKYEPFIVTTSCLTPAQKRSVKNVLRQLGGHVVQEWTKDCSLVIMSNLSVTIKVMCALISCANIVTPEYLTRFLEAAKKGQAKPDPSDFLPPLAESQINPEEISFRADPVRQTLFQGKMFIFLTSKQFKKLNLAIELGGGVPILMEEGTDDNDDSVLIAPGTCVMECSPSENSQQQLSQNAQEWIAHVLGYLQKNKKRPIPESELGFAALHSSTEKYCNPDCNVDGPHLGAMPGPTLSQQVDPYLSQSMAYRTQPSQEMESKHHARPGADFKPPARIVPDSVRVKEEPVSQIFLAEESIQEREVVTATKRKRGRDEEEVEPIKKQVKVERRSRSKSPSPGPTNKGELKSTSPINNNIDDDDKIDFDSVPPRRGQKQVQQKRSPGPDSIPARSHPGRIAGKTSPAPVDVDDGNEFDSVPARSRPGRNAGKTSPAPVDVDDGNEFDSIPARSRPGRNAGKTSPAPVDVDDGNEFDSIPARSRPGRNAGKTSPAPVDVDDGNEFDSIPARSRRGRNAGKTSPAPVDVDDGNEFDSIPDRSRRGRNAGKTSPAPVDVDDGNEFDSIPARSRPGRNAGKTSPAPVDVDDGNEFDSIPARSSLGRNLGKRVPAAVGNDETSEFDRVPARTGGQRGRKRDTSPEVAARDLFSISKTGDVASDSDDGVGTAFDSVPPRKAKKQKRHEPVSRSPSPGEGHNESDFDQVPIRKGRHSKDPLNGKPDGNGLDHNRGKRVKKEVTNDAYAPETVTEDTDFDDLKHVAVDFDSGEGTGVSVVPESDNIDSVPSRKSRATLKQEPAASPPSHVHEAATRMEQDVKPSTTRKASPRRSNLNTAPEEGFLTTARPNENFIKTEENQFDPDVPAACAKVNYASLVVPKQKPTKPGSTMPQAWKGMPGKNFKRFKKVLNKGSHDLPRVIGGRDLVPHSALARKNRVEKFVADLNLTDEEEEDDYSDLFSAVHVPERRSRGKKR